MPQQEREHFSEAVHPLYHPANKPQSDFRETPLEQLHPSAPLMAGCWRSGARCGRSAQQETRLTPPPPNNSPEFGCQQEGLCGGPGSAGVVTVPSSGPCVVPPERQRCKSQASIFSKVLLGSEGPAAPAGGLL